MSGMTPHEDVSTNTHDAVSRNLQEAECDPVIKLSTDELHRAGADTLYGIEPNREEP